MFTLFISDIHLGSPLFNDPIKLFELLSDNKYKNIVIVGDFFDIWEEKIDKIKKEYYRIIDLLNIISAWKNIIIVVGNHDPIVSEYKKLFPKIKIYEESTVLIDDFDKAVKVIHGHQYDDLYLNFLPLVKALFPIEWFFERFGFSLRDHLKEWIRKFLRNFLKSKYDYITSEIEDRMIDEFKDEFDYVVYGHTHDPKIIDNKDIKLVNCGTWVSEKKSCIEYNHDTDIFTLIKL